MTANDTRNVSEMTKVLINKDSSFLKLRINDHSSDSEDSIVLPPQKDGGDPSQGVGSSGLKSMIVSKQTILNQKQLKNKKMNLIKNNL
jgi:hypothetical protein